MKRLDMAAVSSKAKIDLARAMDMEVSPEIEVENAAFVV